jgi:hypothetical protein
MFAHEEKPQKVRVFALRQINQGVTTRRKIPMPDGETSLRICRQRLAQTSQRTRIAKGKTTPMIPLVKKARAQDR